MKIWEGVSNVLLPTFSHLDYYTCYNGQACVIDKSKENIDWGYYSKENGNCEECRAQCDGDSNCDGYDCNHGQCLWWTKEACNSKTIRSSSWGVTTCLFDGKYWRVQKCH